MNFLEAQDELLTDTNDNSVENRERAKTWLNRSMRRILGANRTWSFLIEEHPDSLTASNSLELPEDFRWLYLIKDVDRDCILRPLPYKVFHELHPDRSDTGAAYDYTVVSSPTAAGGRHDRYTIVFDNIDSTDLNITYHKKVVALTEDDSEPPWESEWDWVWISGAMYYAYKFLDRPEEVGLEIREFLKGVARMKAHDSVNTEETIPQLTRYILPARIIYPPKWGYLGY